MRQIANNTFNDGLLMDMQPLTTPNSVLTDCLNGTLITYDGNEFVLQSDDGNGKIYGCKLPKDFVPLGIKEYGGIVYIVSQNPFTGECEIGSFPSPESTIFTDPDKDIPETILSTEDLGDTFATEGITNQTVKLDFGDINTGLLRPGDKFAIYITDTSGNDNTYLDNENFQKFEKLLEVYENLQLVTRNLFKLKLVRISEDGVSESIKEIVPAFTQKNSKGRFYYNKIQLLEEDNISPDGFYAVYNNKVNGYLAVILEIEQVDEFDLSIGNNITVESDSNGKPRTFGFDVSINSRVDKECKNNVAGIEVTTTTIDSSGIVEDSVTQCYNIPEADLKTWEGTTYKYPEGNVIIEQGDLNGKFNVGDNIKVEITPYSKFNYFHNLKYENVISYSKLAFTQESTIWKYYLDRSMDTNIQPDKVLINFDFFVRNTINKRNKLDAMYIEFYDVIANASLFYPIGSISDSKSISINCFTDIPVKYEKSGGVPSDKLTNNKYYLLINKNKTNAYNSALKRIDEGDYSEMNILANNPYGTNKHIPDVCILESCFQNQLRFDNLGVQKKELNNKLRSDNFYLVAICGLDFSPLEDSYKTYICYNFLWTTGVFNKYWELSGSDNMNFNLKKYPEFLDIKFNKQRDTWNDYTEVGELSKNTTIDNVNNENSFQNYDKPFFEVTDSRNSFDTRINIHGDIESQYKLNIDTNKSVLNYGKIYPDREDLEFLNLEHIKDLTSDNYEIIENNNEPSLTTDTKAKTVTISDLSGGTNYKPLEGINITCNIFSNRKIQCAANPNGKLPYPQYKFESFGERYSNKDIFPTTMVVVGCQGRNETTYFWVSSTSDYVQEPLWKEPGFKDGEQWLKNKSGSQTEFYSRLDSIRPSNSYLLRMVQDQNSGGVAGYSTTNNLLPSYNNFDTRLFLIVNGVCIPFTYTCASKEDYSNILVSLNTIIKNEFYFRTTTTGEPKNFKTPQSGLVFYHNNFDSTFDFNIPIMKIKSKSNLSVYTFYKNIEKKLSTLYSSFKSQVITSGGDNDKYKVIGSLFNLNSEIDQTIYIDNLPSQSIDKDVKLEDKFILSGNKFILTTSNNRYTIGNIIEMLNHPSEYIGDVTLPNTWHGNTVFDSTLFVKNPSDTAEDAQGYSMILFNYEPSDGGLNFKGGAEFLPSLYAWAKADEKDTPRYIQMFNRTYMNDDYTYPALDIPNVKRENIW